MEGAFSGWVSEGGGDFSGLGVRGRGIAILSPIMLEYATYCAYSYFYIKYPMKGTEVPNPRRSSACDCTCVSITNRTVS